MAQPSDTDIRLTHKLKDSRALIGVRVLLKEWMNVVAIDANPPGVNFYNDSHTLTIE